MMLILLPGALVALAVGAWAWFNLRPVAGAACHSSRCPQCGRKVRYSPSCAGRAARCLGCRRRWILPGSSPAALSARGGQEGYHVQRKTGLAAR
jgi:hypothetical protein